MKNQAPDIAWFNDAKFGIFIHWGIYAVLTTKHHDGMALWDTAEHLSVVRDTPAGRDLVGRFCKSTGELIRMLAECAGMGGNLLLNAAPLGDGTIFYEQARILREIGAWLKINGEGIYGTRAGLPASHWSGASTCSADGRTVYLILFGRPGDEVPIKGLRNKVLSATVLGGDGTQLARRSSGGAPWMNIPGILWLKVPAAACQTDGTVIKLEVDGPLDFHASVGEVVTQN